ncbi:MAG: acyl-CoA thioesterase [Alphaproteobacteria bacterium]
MKDFLFPIRIYVQHTDAGKIVYHAQYLNFAEQARTELLRALGILYARLRQEAEGALVVRDCHLRFLKPAVLDDALEVRTSLKHLSKTRLTLRQDIYREGVCLVEIEIQLVWMYDSGKPGRLPGLLYEKMQILQEALPFGSATLS